MNISPNLAYAAVVVMAIVLILIWLFGINVAH